MESSTELSAMIRAAMREKELDRQGIAELLGMGDVMVDKLLCGDIVPSRNLEKQMVERLGIASSRVRAVTNHRDKDAKRRFVSYGKGRVA